MDPKKYIGPYSVIGISEEKMKTPTGGEIVRVTFETVPARIMTKRTFDLLVTESPIDATSLEEKFLNSVVNGLFDYLKEYDVTAIQLETLLLQTSRVAKGMFDKASHVAFTKEVYGVSQIASWQRGAPSFTDYRTLNECEVILTNNEQPTEAKN